jgi:hypothetical protein
MSEITSPVSERAVRTTARERGPEQNSVRTASDSVEKILREKYNLLARPDAELLGYEDGVFVFAIDYSNDLWEEIVTDTVKRYPVTESVADITQYVYQEYATEELGIDEGMFSTEHCIVTKSPIPEEYVQAGLSEQQARVQQFVDAGYSDRDIAEWLGLSDGTVKSHRNRIRNKVKQANKLINLVGRKEGNAIQH